MSPTKSEMVANRALSGEEVKELMLADFVRLISQESLLKPHLAYGRISWRIRYTLHTGNQIMDDIGSEIDSKPEGSNITAAIPEIAAKESYPLSAPI